MRAGVARPITEPVNGNVVFRRFQKVGAEFGVIPNGDPAKLLAIRQSTAACGRRPMVGPLPRLIDPKIKFSNIVQTRRNLESIVVYGTGNRLEPMQTRTARVSRIRKLHLWGSPRAANGQKRPKCESAPASHGRGGGFFRRRIGCRHGGDGCHRCRHSKPLDWSRGRPPTNREGCRLRPTMSR